MDATPAIEAAKQHLRQLSLQCRSAFVKYIDNEPPVTAAEAQTLRVRFRRLLKRLRPQNKALLGFTVEADTEEGVAWVHMSRDLVINQVHFVPSEPDGLLLPLWAVYPHYTSVTIFWRMGSGEDYKYKWHAWYRGLTDAQRSEYQRRFPAPTDLERAWAGWYQEVADRAAGGENPVADLIIGRV